MHKPLLNKAVALHQQGAFNAALDLYQEILGINPDLADAYHLMGVVYLQTQQQENAIKSIQKAIQINEKNPHYFSNLGIAQFESKKHVEAVQSFAKALELNPLFAQASFNLGNVYAELRQHKNAVESYIRAITEDDAQFAYHLNLANSYRELGEFLSAIKSYDAALALDQVDASGWFNKGLCWQSMQEPLNAIDCFHRVVKINPEHWDAHWTLGRLSMNLSRWRDAIEHLTLAATGRANSPELWSDMGIALDKGGIPSQAVIAFEQALLLKPNFEQVHNNLGSTLHNMQQYADALHHFEQALAIRPNYNEAQLNKAFTLLLNSQMAEGFQSYECRNFMGEHQPIWLPADKPSWTGQQDIQGQKLLVYSEQGFGDSIQFARYLSLLSARGPKIILAVSSSLKPLFEGNASLFHLIDLNSEFTDFDMHVSLLSLPYILGTVTETIPSEPVQLRVASEAVLKWKSILGEKTRARVGLVWSGSATHTNDAKRSLPLGQLLAYLPDGVDYIALQKEVRVSDAVDLKKSKVKNFSSEINNFQDTAAICQQLDLVISVDTSVAHLSASLACNTWVLLPQVPDWRWFLNRDDSPWYPTVRLFRQEQQGDWNQVLQSVGLALLQHVI